MLQDGENHLPWQNYKKINQAIVNRSLLTLSCCDTHGGLLKVVPWFRSFLRRWGTAAGALGWRWWGGQGVEVWGREKKMTTSFPPPPSLKSELCKAIRCPGWRPQGLCCGRSGGGERPRPSVRASLGLQCATSRWELSEKKHTGVYVFLRRSGDGGLFSCFHIRLFVLHIRHDGLGPASCNQLGSLPSHTEPAQPWWPRMDGWTDG